jgi:hypothetical protein
VEILKIHSSGQKKKKKKKKRRRKAGRQNKPKNLLGVAETVAVHADEVAPLDEHHGKFAFHFETK